MDSQSKIVARHLKSAPVNLEAIFDELGIGYSERKLGYGQSGWIERIGPNYKVIINSDEPLVRRRFTAAHELAHYLLHRDLMEDGSRMNRHIDSLFDGKSAADDNLFKPYHETQANKIAAQIVMPIGIVKKLHGAGKTPAEIAAALEVSKAAMEIRLSTLGLT